MRPPRPAPRRQRDAARGDDSGALIREFDAHRRGAGAATEARAGPNGLAQRVAAVAAFLRCRMTGDYTNDEFGFDPHFHVALLMPLLRTLFSAWFRVEV